MSVSIIDLFNDKKLSFVKISRAIDNDEKALKCFEETNIIKFANVKCKCGVNGASFFTKNTDTSIKCGFRLRCKVCGARVNPLKNTFFEKCRLSYLQVFELIVNWLFRIPVRLTLLNTGCNTNAITDWRSYIREVCQTANLNRLKKQIGGPGHWVEIDETHLFRRKYRRGHRIRGESIWLFGGIDRETKKRFIIRVPNRKKRTLWPLIKRYVAPGSILVTDDHKSYEGIDKHPAMKLSAHEVVVHKYNFVNPAFREIYTNNVECVWGKLKRLVKRSGSNESIDQYIAEFVYRVHLDIRFGRDNYGQKLQYIFNDIRMTYPGPNSTGFKHRFTNHMRTDGGTNHIALFTVVNILSCYATNAILFFKRFSNFVSNLKKFICD